MMRAGIELEPISRRGRASLTPMIDVVFLLLVFFMLAASFTEAEKAIRLAPSGAGDADADSQPYEGAPRLVQIRPDDVRVNGIVVPVEGLAAALEPLMPSQDAVVILRPERGASLQRTVAVIDALAAEGITAVVLAEEEEAG
ncbi:MAG: biopolymer transporter ExbD [Pseudomonadota bacterium]